MKLHLANLGETQLFTAYDNAHIMVNRVPFGSGIVVQATAVHEDWGVDNFAALSLAHFDYFLALQPEVLLIGTGARQQFAHPRLYRHLSDAGIAVEFMDTPAACRTYNILVAEDRKVIAAVLL